MHPKDMKLPEWKRGLNMKIELIDVRKYTNIEHFQLQVSGTSCRNYEKLVDKVNAEIVKQLELDPRAKDIELKKYENDSF